MIVKELVERLLDIDDQLEVVGLYDMGFGIGPITVDVGTLRTDPDTTVCFIEVES